MRQRFQRFLARAHHSIQQALSPPKDQTPLVSQLLGSLSEARQAEDLTNSRYMEMVQELVDARQMAGTGPWLMDPKTAKAGEAFMRQAHESMTLKESIPVTAVGAFGDLALALENVQWRREISLSWLEFSRWGIQQIILISRLYYLKNPMIRRAINVVTSYVMGRGVEVSSDDPDVDAILKDFFERNKKVLGQNGLVELQRQKLYDGNLFFALFADKTDTGKVSCRTIDATEIMDIVTDPDDADTPWFYRRDWTYKDLGGATSSRSCWYPALEFKPDQEIPILRGVPVDWNMRIHHRRDGAISKWHFGCPRAYPALDWAKAGREILENCATRRRALAQFAMKLTTKGGQQALQGAKQQLGTNVGVTSGPWDTNPPATQGSIFASGPGTTLEAFNIKGALDDPKDVTEYRVMVGICFDVPPTMLGDMDTANLATATSLDRPTEQAMRLHQEAWTEDFVIMGTYVLEISGVAASGKLREARRLRETAGGTPIDLSIKVNWPAIREGDMGANVTAIIDAMTLGNKGGQVVGIDEKKGVEMLFSELGAEDYQDIVDDMYPDGEYDPDRTKEPLPAPIGKALPPPGGQPQNPGGQQLNAQDKPVTTATN